MNPTPHKHAALIKQLADEPEWWDVFAPEETRYRCSFMDVVADIYGNIRFEPRKSAKHPDNLKPKKRLIDWSKMPRGTMTNRGALLRSYALFAQTLAETSPFYVADVALNELRLKEQTEFTYWGGGECPVPDGVVVECICRSGIVWKTKAPAHPEAKAYVWQHDFGDQDIIAYRIIGLAEGWTDDPSEAV